MGQGKKVRWGDPLKWVIVKISNHWSVFLPTEFMSVGSKYSKRSKRQESASSNRQKFHDLRGFPVKSKDDQRSYFYACPNCQSAVGEKCTQPTDTGRKPVSFIHSARLRLVEEADYFARENQRGERLDNRSKID